MVTLLIGYYVQKSCCKGQHNLFSILCILDNQVYNCNCNDTSIYSIGASVDVIFLCLLNPKQKTVSNWVGSMSMLQCTYPIVYLCWISLEHLYYMWWISLWSTSTTCGGFLPTQPGLLLESVTNRICTQGLHTVMVTCKQKISIIMSHCIWKDNFFRTNPCFQV